MRGKSIRMHCGRRHCPIEFKESERQQWLYSTTRSTERALLLSQARRMRSPRIVIRGGGKIDADEQTKAKLVLPNNGIALFNLRLQAQYPPNRTSITCVEIIHGAPRCATKSLRPVLPSTCPQNFHKD
jgi:hypothetical protein